MMPFGGINSCALLCMVLFYCLGIDYAFKTIILAQSSPIQPTRPAVNATGNWTYIGTKGGIETYLKKVEGTDLLATRGVAYLDMHISQAMGPYINLSLAYDWVSMLKHIQQYPARNSDDNNARVSHDVDEDVVYQTLELPWPVAPRDVVLHRKFSWDADERIVTINYHSIEDERCPRKPGTVRADSPHSMWRFRSVPSCDYIEDRAKLNNQEVASGLPDVNEHFSRLKRLIAFFQRRFRKSNSTGTFELSVLFARRSAPIMKKSKRDSQKIQLSDQGGLTPAHPLPGQARHWFAEGVRRFKEKAFIKLFNDMPRVVRTERDNDKDVHVHINDQQPQKSQPKFDERTSNGLAVLACSTSRPVDLLSSRGRRGTHGAGLGSRQCTRRGTEWRGVGTVIEFESLVDSHGSVPAWLINHLQRSFPAQALSAYRALAEKQIAAPYEKVLNW